VKATLLISTIWISAASISWAQVATDSRLQSSEVTPTPLPSAPPPQKVPERSQIDEIFKQTSLGKDADERRLHLEWRDLANRVANDRDIIAAKKSAEQARTDLEKRQRLRDYYDLYYGRMRALASSSQMRAALDQLRLAHVSQTTQRRVRPEEDASLPTPSPTPKKKQKGGRLSKFQGHEG